MKKKMTISQLARKHTSLFGRLLGFDKALADDIRSFISDQGYSLSDNFCDKVNKDSSSDRFTEGKAEGAMRQAEYSKKLYLENYSKVKNPDMMASLLSELVSVD
jgi:hypothetical protein